MSDDTNTYVLRAPCGCIRGAVVDDGGKNVPEFVADGIKRGYTAVPLPSRFVRETSWRCNTPACTFRTSGTR